MTADTMRMTVTRKWRRTLHAMGGDQDVISVQAEGNTWPCSLRFTVQEERQAPLIGSEVTVAVTWGRDSNGEVPA